jgi:hypothetical protein
LAIDRGRAALDGAPELDKGRASVNFPQGNDQEAAHVPACRVEARRPCQVWAVDRAPAIGLVSAIVPALAIGLVLQIDLAVPTRLKNGATICRIDSRREKIFAIRDERTGKIVEMRYAKTGKIATRTSKIAMKTGTTAAGMVAPASGGITCGMITRR